jgi:hypothetical protein
VFDKILNALFIFVPIAIWLGLTESSPSSVFLVSCLAIIPLAGLMGRGTEHLTRHVGPGLGGLSWDADHHVWWACALDPSITNPALSKLVGYITRDHRWHQAAIAPHGCMNNVTYTAGLVYADGAYANSHATSTTVDAGAVTVTSSGALHLPAKLPDLHPVLWSPHVSGNLFNDAGHLEWQVDQFGRTKTVWHNGVIVLSGTLRYEQLACNETTGTVYLKWFNENRYGVFPTAGC